MRQQPERPAFQRTQSERAAGGLPDDLSDQEKIAQPYARQLSSEHHVDAALYSVAERAFGHRGLVEIAYLTGTLPYRLRTVERV